MMNNIFSVDGYFSDCLALLDSIKVYVVIVDGSEVPFKLMVLSESQKELIEACDNYDEMIDTAANNGICFNEERVIDGVLAGKLKGLWVKSDNNEDPSTKQLIGAEVCRISGLDTVLIEQLAKETEYHEQQTSINESTDTSLSIEECAENVAAANL